MPKIVIFVSVIAAIAGSASVRGELECATAQEQGGEESRCFGPQETQKKPCCEGFKCVQQNSFYGQCLAADAEVPLDWDGNEIPFGSPSIAAPISAPQPAPTPAPEPAPITEPNATTVEAPEPDPEPAPEPAPGLMITTEDDPAEGPGFTIISVGNYMRIIAKDYIPNVSPPNAVMVEDIPEGSSVVESQNECEGKCSATEGCNAASFYTDASDLPNEHNCWLKIMEDSCELPIDSIDDANAILLLKLADCDVIGADAPLDIAIGPDTMAPGPDTLGGVVGGLTPQDAEDQDLGETAMAPPPSESVTDAAVTIRTAYAVLLTAAGAFVCTALL